MPSALVQHEFQGSSRRHVKTFVRLHCMRNRVRMLLKNGSLRFVARTLPLSFRELARTAVEVGPNILPGFVQAAIDGARQRAEVGARTSVGRGAIESRWVKRAK